MWGIGFSYISRYVILSLMDYCGDCGEEVLLGHEKVCGNRSKEVSYPDILGSAKFHTAEFLEYSPIAQRQRKYRFLSFGIKIITIIIFLNIWGASFGQFDTFDFGENMQHVKEHWPLIAGLLKKYWWVFALQVAMVAAMVAFVIARKREVARYAFEVHQKGFICVIDKLFGMQTIEVSFAHVLDVYKRQDSFGDEYVGLLLCDPKLNKWAYISKNRMRVRLNASEGGSAITLHELVRPSYTFDEIKKAWQRFNEKQKKA